MKFVIWSLRKGISSEKNALYILLILSGMTLTKNRAAITENFLRNWISLYLHEINRISGGDWWITIIVLSLYIQHRYCLPNFIKETFDRTLEDITSYDKWKVVHFFFTYKSNFTRVLGTTENNFSKSCGSCIIKEAVI